MKIEYTVMLKTDVKDLKGYVVIPRRDAHNKDIRGYIEGVVEVDMDARIKALTADDVKVLCVRSLTIDIQREERAKVEQALGISKVSERVNKAVNAATATIRQNIADMLKAGTIDKSMAERMLKGM